MQRLNSGLAQNIPEQLQLITVSVQDLFQRQPARHDVPLYEKKIINLLLLFGLPRLPRLFLFSAKTCLGPAVVHTLMSG